MPHVALVPFTGFRVREPEMLALGMSLPGLLPRAAAVAQFRHWAFSPWRD